MQSIVQDLYGNGSYGTKELLYRPHSYGPNGIGMRTRAQYKVYNTILNDPRLLSHIRHARLGHDFKSVHRCRR